MMEKAIASGMRARATTRPESRSPRILPSHCWRTDVVMVSGKQRQAKGMNQALWRSEKGLALGARDGRNPPPRAEQRPTGGGAQSLSGGRHGEKNPGPPPPP